MKTTSLLLPIHMMPRSEQIKTYWSV